MPRNPSSIVPQTADTPQSAMDRLRHLHGLGAITLVDQPPEAELWVHTLDARLRSLSDKVAGLEAFLAEEMARAPHDAAPPLSPVIEQLSLARRDLAALIQAVPDAVLDGSNTVGSHGEKVVAKTDGASLTMIGPVQPK